MKLVSIVLLFSSLAGILGVNAPAVAEPRVVDQWYPAVHTITDARSLMTTVEAYYIDHKRYPAASSIEELRTLVEPVYIRHAPLKDAWGTPFLYRVSEDGKSYTIASAGSDKKFDESTWAAGYSTSSKDDLVYRGNLEKEWVIQRICR